MHRYLLIILGLLLITLGIAKEGSALICVWTGIDFLIVALAHFRWAHNVFGKKANGTLPFWSWMLFLPLHAYTCMVWHLYRILSAEEKCSTISDQLQIGRRLLGTEKPHEEFANYVDLTSEFTEPVPFRRSPVYFSFPILDGSAPSPEALLLAVSNLKPGRTFIHCAQGHGRTGLFAAAVLLKSGEAQTAEEALRLIQCARPGIRLSKAQENCIQLFEELTKRPKCLIAQNEG